MTREIKFRAWDKKREIMIGSDYPNNWANEREEWWWDNDAICLTAIEEAVKNENLEIMQFTGLKDKNGKEIYEGDIVKKGDKIYFVAYKMASFELRKESDSVNCASGRRNYCDWLLSEIIGNIYSNPELLKGEYP